MDERYKNFLTKFVSYLGWLSVLQYCVYALFFFFYKKCLFCLSFSPQTDALRLSDEREMLMRKLAESEAEKRV